MLSLCNTLITVLKSSIHFRIVYYTMDFSTTFIQYIQHNEVTANQLKSNRCFHCGTSSISVPTLLRDSLLFEGFLFYFDSIYPTYRCHGEPAEIKPMLSLCNTPIDVLKFSIHFWGKSSTSVPTLWRDSLLFKGFYYCIHSLYSLYGSHGEPAEVKPMLSLCKT